MAKPEHVAMLKESVKAWNEWRHDNLGILPALLGADLEKTNLKGADLRISNLEEARLSGADLREANLRGAKLKGAKLKGANLKGANLMDANLTGTAYLQAEQLYEAKTLYKSKLDQEIESKVRENHPILFERPTNKSNR